MLFTPPSFSALGSLLLVDTEIYSSTNATSGHNSGSPDCNFDLSSGSPGYAITFFLSVGSVLLISGQG